MSLSVVAGRLVAEGVCKICALEQQQYVIDKICTDCWESMVALGRS